MLPCTLRQLEIFLAAAEDCHFVRTANRLGISQAAVSSHIAALEHQLGRPLFIRRRGRKPLLSTYGMELLSEARSFVAEADKLRDFKTRTERPKRVTVRVCAGGHLLDDGIKRHLSRFYQRHANFYVECHLTDSPAKGVQLVQDGRMDMLLFTVANPADYPLHAEILRPVRFGLYASPALSVPRDATPEELSTLPFILPPEGSEACRMVQLALLERGIVCKNVAARAQFIMVAKDMAKYGEGIVALFDTMVTPEDEASLMKLDVELRTMYRTLFRAHGPMSSAVAQVADFLRETLS
ncbi:MAG TPA: LysR family transcriptional regulator [Gammaproteobacteria bacterium]